MRLAAEAGIFSTKQPDAYTPIPPDSKIVVTEFILGHDIHRPLDVEEGDTVVDLLNRAPLPENVTAITVSRRRGLLKKDAVRVIINGEPSAEDGPNHEVTVPLVRGERPTYKHRKGDLIASVPVELYAHPGILARYAP